MSLELELPEMLDLPDKLLPLITKFNDYRYFLVDGGRVSGKSQSIARLLLTIAEKNLVRVVCGRETQNTIEESVYTLFKDLVYKYSLNWRIKASSLEHKVSGSSIIFKGFREQGSVNIKGLEGVDILWVEEAQAITQKTLDVIIPTIRKPNSKIFFTMNRTIEDDPVYKAFSVRDDCLKISINYDENKHCPQEIKDEALKMLSLNKEAYNHIWLGIPLANGNSRVFHKQVLEHCFTRHELLSRHACNRGVAVDPAGMGVDDNVFCAGNGGEVLEWFEKMVMSPTEKAIRAVEMCKKVNGWWIVVDCDGLGIEMYQEITNMSNDYLGGIQVLRFHGSGASTLEMAGRPMYHNARAEAAFVAQRRAYQGIAAIDPSDRKLIEELEQDVSFTGGRGLQQLIAKEDIKKVLKRSPGRADAWKMFQWGCDQNIQDTRLRDNGVFAPVQQRFPDYAQCD